MDTVLTWLSDHLKPWTLIGLFGQAMFMGRFLVQWIVSEREKKSVIPEMFWYFSLGGGLIVFIYAVHQEDIVFILGQGLGVFIYLRNIWFIWVHKKKRITNA